MTAKRQNRRALFRGKISAIFATLVALWVLPSGASGQTLYVASNGGPVGAYNAATGATINANFIPGSGIGPYGVGPYGLTVSDNILYVANYGGGGFAGPIGSVGTYNATTGTAINASFISGLSTGPQYLAISGSILYVTGSEGSATYNAGSGAVINPNFSGSGSLVISGNTLYTGGGATYNASTSALINSHFFPGGDSLAISDNILYVLSYETIATYNATTGAAIDTNFITGLIDAEEIAISGNTLFVTNYDGSVETFNATTGASINPNFITGLGSPIGLAVYTPSWHSRQLTTTANMASGSRTGAANTSLDHYYYKGTDNNVWAVYWNGNAWTQKALTSNANVSDWLTFQPNYGYLYYQGSNNQIWVVYFDGTQWRQAQQTTNGNIASDLVVDTVWNFFYYRGTDGNVWADYWNGTAWTQKALTSLANVAGTAGNGGNLSVDSALHFIYYRGTDGNMWVCYFNGTSWITQKLSTTANVGGAVTADANNVVHYRSSVDNTAWAEYFNGTAWTQKQLNATTPMASATSLYAQYVMLYVNSSGQAETLYFDGTNWDAVLLGDGASTLTTGLSVNPANSWIFCGRSDGNVVIFYYQ